MQKPLRILHLEDDPDYPGLVRSLLEAEGVPAVVVPVANRPEFEAALGGEPFDVILADYSLTEGYDGIQALRWAQDKRPDTPFLVVSGTIGEQAAIESLKSGATDYVLKQWPERLVPAVRRAAQEAEERRRRRQAEMDLRQSEEQYRLIFDNNPVPMWVFDHDTLAFLEVNDAAVQHYGYSREEFSNMTLKDIRGSDETPALIEYLHELVAAEHPTRLALAGIWAHRKKDGALIEVEVKWSPIRFKGRAASLTMANDITTQKRLEDQLRQAQKMEAIGQLAGGVAHDFNNILTVIHGHAELLLTEGRPSERASHSARQISQAAERGAALTRQLLAFSRRQVMQPRLLDMNEIVGNMTKMLSRIVGEDIALQLHYCPQPAPVRADAGMIEQVLLNLVVNARDAMPQGGRVVIKVTVAEVDTAHLDQHPEGRQGRFVCLSVADTGCGIAPDNLPHIFEPFFTTKEVGKGTGLGLATVYGIANQHRGWVEVESEPGKGAAFGVFLPWSDAVQGGPSEDPSTRLLPRGGSEMILVVEDEAPLRDLVCRYLARCGYRILQAETGAKALELWAARSHEIDLVLTDLVMPDRMNGRQLAERLQADRPDVKILFTSGYSAEVVGKDFVLRPGLNYLPKPFQPQKLAAIVRACLDAKLPRA
jgi:PAS domain S-box-containing protein